MHTHHTKLKIWVILNLSYKTISTAWYWHKNRHLDQWCRNEDPDISPDSYDRLIFVFIEAKATHLKQYSITNKQWWSDWIVTWNLILTTCPVQNSKWIKDLDIRPSPWNRGECRVRKYTLTFRHRKEFSEQAPDSTGIKTNNWPMGPYKTEMLMFRKRPCHGWKETHYRTGKEHYQLHFNRVII